MRLQCEPHPGDGVAEVYRLGEMFQGLGPGAGSGGTGLEMTSRQALTPSTFGTFHRFIRRRDPAETCEFCRRVSGPKHQHLLDPDSRKLIYSCDACAILFSDRGQTKYKRVPRHSRYLADFMMTESQWDSLMLPINMAFFLKSSTQGRIVALYPSSTGATESSIAFDAWDEIGADNPVLRDMETDVEALLVNRIQYARARSAAEYYIAPIDECFKLLDLIRSRWHGLSGGPEVWREIGGFFESLRARSIEIARSFPCLT